MFARACVYVCTGARCIKCVRGGIGLSASRCVSCVLVSSCVSVCCDGTATRVRLTRVCACLLECVCRCNASVCRRRVSCMCACVVRDVCQFVRVLYMLHFELVHQCHCCTCN